MKKYLKLIYIVVSLVFLILSIIEIVNYFNIFSNLYAVIYMLVNLFLIFLFFGISVNYRNKNYKLRVSKCIIIIVLGIICSYILPNIIESMSYVDSSNYFISSNYLIIYVFKPSIYFILLVLSIYELKFIKH